MNNAVSTYDVIADEYYDARFHPTCHNFLRLSRLYIADQLPDPREADDFLEVGAGESAAASILHARGCRLDCLTITDLSAPMLRHSAQWQRFGASLQVEDATRLTVPARSLTCVVASLADPYNVPEFWHSAARALRPNGRAIVTLPAFEWANRFRSNQPGDFSSAVFKTRAGTTVRVRSFINELVTQISMIQQAGLTIVNYRALGSDLLQDEPLSSKLLVFDDNDEPVVLHGFTAAKVQSERDLLLNTVPDGAGEL